MAMRLRLTEGLPVLERWAASASQADKNAMYKALFSVGDGTAFLIYDVFPEGTAKRFIFQVKEDLRVKIGIHNKESFDILHIGAEV
ncbi:MULTISPECIES: DUF6235 family protein [unclassified Amycolatopsis]|uniref:DUF6235 family protein n=1 Tax=unclassified Amycolatopsis TaxID=2618356 RepID=UPI003523255C